MIAKTRPTGLEAAVVTAFAVLDADGLEVDEEE